MLVVAYGPTSPTSIPAAGQLTFEDEFLGFGQQEVDYITMQVFLDFVTAGGTSIDAFLQTSFDDGITWRDVANLQVLAADVVKVAAINKYIAAAVLTAASDGALAINTIVNGVFGSRWRVRLIIAGAYAADNIYRLHVSGQKVR